MSIDPVAFRHFAAAPWAGAAPPAPAPSSARVPSPAPAAAVDPGIPATPPADVLEQVAAAADCIRELVRNNRELHFRPDAQSPRIIIEVCDMSGNVLRTIPPSKALELITGSPGRETTWLA